jgi:hypothetical protein
MTAINGSTAVVTGEQIAATEGSREVNSSNRGQG